MIYNLESAHVVLFWKLTGFSTPILCLTSFLTRSVLCSFTWLLSKSSAESCFWDASITRHNAPGRITSIVQNGRDQLQQLCRTCTWCNLWITSTYNSVNFGSYLRCLCIISSSMFADFFLNLPKSLIRLFCTAWTHNWGKLSCIIWMSHSHPITFMPFLWGKMIYDLKHRKTRNSYI